MQKVYRSLNHTVTTAVWWRSMYLEAETMWLSCGSLWYPLRSSLSRKKTHRGLIQIGLIILCNGFDCCAFVWMKSIEPFQTRQLLYLTANSFSARRTRKSDKRFYSTWLDYVTHCFQMIGKIHCIHCDILVLYKRNLMINLVHPSLMIW